MSLHFLFRNVCCSPVGDKVLCAKPFEGNHSHWSATLFPGAGQGISTLEGGSVPVEREQSLEVALSPYSPLHRAWSG